MQEKLPTKNGSIPSAALYALRFKKTMNAAAVYPTVMRAGRAATFSGGETENLPVVSQKNKDADHPRLLIVDDNAVMLDILRVILSKHFVIRTAGSGKEALGMAVGFSPDVVLTDFRMPGINGLELIAHIQAMRVPCRFLMYSAEADAELVHNAGLLGVECLAKPFDLNVLTQKLVTLAGPEKKMAAVQDAS